MQRGRGRHLAGNQRHHFVLDQAEWMVAVRPVRREGRLVLEAQGRCRRELEKGAVAWRLLCGGGLAVGKYTYLRRRRRQSAHTVFPGHNACGPCGKYCSGTH